MRACEIWHGRKVSKVYLQQLTRLQRGHSLTYAWIGVLLAARGELGRIGEVKEGGALVETVVVDGKE